MHFTDEEHAVKPPAFAVVPAHAFKATWSERPTSEVAVGLRLLATDDLQAARGTAAKTANEAHPGIDTDDPVNWPLWVECFNDALMVWIVAHGICDPNDASKPWEPFKAAPEDMARAYLTTGGVKFLFDRWEKMRIDTDPTSPEIDDTELEALPDVLDDKLRHCGPARAARIRRMLAFVLDELHAVTVPTPTTT